MTHIKVKKGLDIPILGKPNGSIQTLESPRLIALDLSPFYYLRLRPLAKERDQIAIGQPVVEDKASGRVFVAPASGTIKEIRRGIKHSLKTIVIEVNGKEKFYELDRKNLASASKDEILEKLKTTGFFPHISVRPFNLIPKPGKFPKSIFIKAVESAPFIPPAEMQVEGNEKNFQTGLTLLSKLADGNIHLMHKASSSCLAFSQAKDVQIHTCSGPHPVGNVSLHIHKIDPIRSKDDVVWTLRVSDVIAIGKWVNDGIYHVDRVISIAGPGIEENKRGYFRARTGFSISECLENRISDKSARMISGDPLMGTKVGLEDFLGYQHFSISAFVENKTRKFLHFLRLGSKKYTATRTYFSGRLKFSRKDYDFTTAINGEERTFIDSNIYDKVMPMRIPTIQLVKSVLGEDFDTAEKLGLLEVAGEDFALPAFICPSKVEMVEIIENGLQKYAEEMLHF